MAKNLLSNILCLAGAFGIGATGMAIAMTKCKASERQPMGFVIVHRPATVPGILDTSRPGRHYQGGPVVTRRPTADVRQLPEVAPPNGCEGQGGGFKIESGKGAGQCVGGARRGW